MPIKKSEDFTPKELLSSNELLNYLIGLNLKEVLEKKLVKVHAEKLEEYRAKGFEEGLAKMYAEKYAKNYEIGFVKGVINERIKIALSLKRNGVSTDLIAKSLGMSIEEVEELTAE